MHAGRKYWPKACHPVMAKRPNHRSNSPSSAPGTKLRQDLNSGRFLKMFETCLEKFGKSARLRHRLPSNVEAFEHVAKVFLEAQGYAVSTNVKFFIRRRTKKQAYEEYQEHGYEVDLVAARADELLLGSVKSFLGSHGLSRQFFREIADLTKKPVWESNKLFNEPEVQSGVLDGCTQRFGYPREKVFLGLFVGKFKQGHEEAIRSH